MLKVVTVHTKLNKNDTTSKTTALTLDFTGCTMNDLLEPATDSLVITWQGRKRRAKAIPAAETLKVKEFLASIASRSAGPETVESLAAKGSTMSKEERERIIALLRAADKPAKAA